jgi:hypothetical protein
MMMIKAIEDKNSGLAKDEREDSPHSHCVHVPLLQPQQYNNLLVFLPKRAMSGSHCATLLSSS